MRDEIFCAIRGGRVKAEVMARMSRRENSIKEAKGNGRGVDLLRC